MEFVIPLLETKIKTLVAAFRFAVFAMLVAGLIVHMSRHQHHGGDLVRPLARAIVITAAVAGMPWWFSLVENTFLATADYIDANYTENPTGIADTIREGFAQSQNPEGKEWSWRKLNESIYNAITNTIAWCLVGLGTLITSPLIILHYILRCVLYLLTPFALACFMIPALAGHGIRFLQQLLAIFAWPVGFAITNLVVVAIWQDFRGIVGPNPDNPGLYVASPFLDQVGAILATLVLVIGHITTPVICQMLFAQGYALTGASGHPVAIGRNIANKRPSRGSAPAKQANPASPPPSSPHTVPGL
ncbi:MAG: hypothetical protein LBK99_10855 [Opitutaceae bacterium]|jgi:hypothetical protein|nr:hypothetical protein [Opitutaceae bacterium]